MEKDTQEDFLNKSKNKYGDKFDYSKVNYINNNSRTTFRCLRHNCWFETTPRIHLYGSLYGGCKECAKESKIEKGKKKLFSKEEFISKSKNKYGDKYDYLFIEYTGCNSVIKLKCNECGNIFDITPHRHLKSNDGGCLNCAVKKVSALKKLCEKEIIKKCKKVFGDLYDYSKINYKGCNEKIEIVCKEHGSFWKLPYNFYGKLQGCPKCLQSIGEKIIQSVINEFGYEKQTIYEKSFDDLKDNRKLSYDFYIEPLNTLIEFQGIQHFEWVEVFQPTYNDFLRQLKHDKMKKEYAEKNGYKFFVFSSLKNLRQELEEKLNICTS